MKLRLSALLLCLAMLFCMTACGAQDNRSNDVVVLFTNDVHCGIDTNIGYAGLSAYKKSLSEKYRYVVLADCGDFVQGSYEGVVSKGEYIVELKNAVGYDFSIFGNHEFDFGMDQLKRIVELSDSHFLNCNISYTGSGEDWMSEATKPYEIVTYGDIKVAFIGISTPWSISSSTPKHFMENGELVYDFCEKDGARHFYDNAQKYIDECNEKGADFVVVLSHLGIDVDIEGPFTSIDLVANTTGIDVVLDAHSHVKAPCWIMQNKDGEDVMISSTGTELSAIGQLILTDDGTASVGYIDRYTVKDDAITAQIADIRKQLDNQMKAVIGHIDTDLSCYDSDGIRMVRSREVAIGDFVADAYRILTGADIGMCNGGGIRADLNVGDVTYGDVISVYPYDNTICVVEVTGAEIVDMMEYFYRNVQAEYSRDGVAFGEDGSFQQVSGLKFTVDTSVDSSVQVNETDAFIGVGGARRISDVMVLKDGAYTPIDLDATYTLASHDYMIKNGGSGMLYFLADHKLVIDEALPIYQVLIDYLSQLDGDLSQYKTVDNRITIKQ
ncbi:MAG: bifunctional metallophosphatase/5'-nucleotidase [Clostridia bacterium]|nr:bifunctional metallophosphatase/5'-nucleotidase [Clostridia bacterium]